MRAMQGIPEFFRDAFPSSVSLSVGYSLFIVAPIVCGRFVLGSCFVVV